MKRRKDTEFAFNYWRPMVGLDVLFLSCGLCHGKNNLQWRYVNDDFNKTEVKCKKCRDKDLK